VVAPWSWSATPQTDGASAGTDQRGGGGSEQGTAGVLALDDRSAEGVSGGNADGDHGERVREGLGGAIGGNDLLDGSAERAQKR
jgi:hypothetical protein